MSDQSSIITIMSKAVRAVSGQLVRDFGELENLQVSRKGTTDFVSSADLKSEKRILEELKRGRPDYAFLLEESGAIEGKDERFRWVVDPLDGTNNFLHGVPFFAVTMALEKKNVRGEYEVEAAVTHEVVSRETYWAERGKGAWFETGHHAARQRLQVSSRKELSHALLCVGSLKRDAGVVEKIAGHVSGVRCLGSTALSMAYVAAGRFDVFVQSESYRWDVAAGLLLIKEAKGMVTDFREGAVVQERSDVVASNGLLHTKILACCR